jgi:hypothetical protein
MGHCIIYELLIDPLYFQVCSYEAFVEAIKDYNTITSRLSYAIERLQHASMLRDRYMQELISVAKFREQVSVLCSQIKATDFNDVKKALQPLFRAILIHFNVSTSEVKAMMQYQDHLELNFLERSKSTQADIDHLPLKQSL